MVHRQLVLVDSPGWPLVLIWCGCVGPSLLWLMIGDGWLIGERDNHGLVLWFTGWFGRPIHTTINTNRGSVAAYYM